MAQLYWLMRTSTLILNNCYPVPSWNLSNNPMLFQSKVGREAILAYLNRLTCHPIYPASHLHFPLPIPLSSVEKAWKPRINEGPKARNHGSSKIPLKFSSYGYRSYSLYSVMQSLVVRVKYWHSMDSQSWLLT